MPRYVGVADLFFGFLPIGSCAKTGGGVGAFGMVRACWGFSGVTSSLLQWQYQPDILEQSLVLAIDRSDNDIEILAQHSLAVHLLDIGKAILLDFS